MVANSESLLQFEGIPHVAPLLVLTPCIIIYSSAAHSHDHSVVYVIASQPDSGLLHSLDDPVMPV